MYSLLRVLIIIIFVKCLAKAGRIRVNFPGRMSDQQVVDLDASLPTAAKQTLVTVRGQSRSNNLGLYFRGRRQQIYVRFGSRRMYVTDRRNLSPGKYFRMVIRQNPDTVTVFILNDRHRVWYEKDYPIVASSIELGGAYRSGHLTKSNWEDYIELPETCGQTNVDREVPLSYCTLPQAQNTRVRIVGGTPANAGQHPWQVGILTTRYAADGTEEWYHICGGTIIHECWVLSAAHCFFRPAQPEIFRIRVGDYYNRDGGDKKFATYENMQEIRIEKIINHPSYQSGAYTINDITMVKLKADRNGRCATFGNFVQPACLPTSYNQFDRGTECVITGWGATKHRQESKDYPPCLQKARVTLVTNERCKDDYPDEITSSGLTIEKIPPTVQCTDKSGQNATDSCQGDSGGPLVCASGGASVLWGITSWGAGCADKYGIYTRVASFIPFIKKAMFEWGDFNPRP